MYDRILDILRDLGFSENDQLKTSPNFKYSIRSMQIILIKRSDKCWTG
jgi:hypothetical protein